MNGKYTKVCLAFLLFIGLAHESGASAPATDPKSEKFRSQWNLVLIDMRARGGNTDVGESLALVLADCAAIHKMRADYNQFLGSTLPDIHGIQIHIDAAVRRDLNESALFAELATTVIGDKDSISSIISGQVEKMAAATMVSTLNYEGLHSEARTRCSNFMRLPFETYQKFVRYPGRVSVGPSQTQPEEIGRYLNGALDGNIEDQYRVALGFRHYCDDYDPSCLVALYWLFSAADAGHAGAQANLGSILSMPGNTLKLVPRGSYFHSIRDNELGNVAVNDEQASYWFSRAADQGVPYAIGALCERAQGPDSETVCVQAANQGNSAAINVLAEEFVHSGRNWKSKPVDYAKWYLIKECGEQLRRCGDQSATLSRALESLAFKLSSEEVESAFLQARSWKSVRQCDPGEARTWNPSNIFPRDWKCLR